MRLNSAGLFMVAIPAMVLLAACSGGGSSAATAGFTSWSAILAPSTTNIPGIATQVSVEVALAPGSGESVVTSVSTPAPITDIRFTQVRNASGELTRISFTTPTGSLINFDTAAGALIGDLGAIGLPGILAAVDASETSVLLAAIPQAFGWNFQTFGVWQAQTGVGTETAGFASIGAVSPLSGIPAAGSASYVGEVGGLYVTAAGASLVVTGDLSAQVNFLSRRVDISASGMQMTDDLLTFTSAPHLNFSGVATYGTGSGTFSGSVQTPSGLSGTTTGRFYGPTAEELGGIGFMRAGAGVEALGVAYGARR